MILLNGASSSGKSSLAKALQADLPEPFLHVSSDHFVTAGMLPEHLARRAEHLPTRLTEGGSLKVNVALRGRLTMPRHNPRRKDGFDLRVTVNAWNTLEEHMAAWDAVVARRWPDPIPTIFTVPTATDPSQAPDGQDTAWIWSGIAPVRAHEPWEDVRDKIGQRVIDAEE